MQVARYHVAVQSQLHLFTEHCSHIVYSGSFATWNHRATSPSTTVTSISEWFNWYQVGIWFCVPTVGIFTASRILVRICTSNELGLIYELPVSDLLLDLTFLYHVYVSVLHCRRSSAPTISITAVYHLVPSLLIGVSLWSFVCHCLQLCLSYCTIFGLHYS